MNLYCWLGEHETDYTPHPDGTEYGEIEVEIEEVGTAAEEEEPAQEHSELPIYIF